MVSLDFEFECVFFLGERGAVPRVSLPDELHDFFCFFVLCPFGAAFEVAGERGCGVVSAAVACCEVYNSTDKQILGGGWGRCGVPLYQSQHFP